MSYSRHNINGEMKMNLPSLAPTAEKTLVIGETTVRVGFGDLFTPESTDPNHWVPCIVNMKDGILYKIWGHKNGSIHITKVQDGFYKVGSKVPGIPYGLMFNYKSDFLTWHEVFEGMAKLMEPNDVMVVPTFGTNNSIKFHDSAFGILMGIRACLENEESELHKLKEIRIVTPYSHDQETTSSRTIRHMFNMIDIMNQSVDSENGKLCIVCMTRPRDIILPCNHMLICKYCEMKFAFVTHGPSLCVLCKQSYNTKLDCFPLSSPEYECCDSSNEKTELTYIPCGHTSILCADCESDAVNECPVCKTKIEKKQKIYG